MAALEKQITDELIRIDEAQKFPESTTEFDAADVKNKIIPNTTKISSRYIIHAKPDPIGVYTYSNVSEKGGGTTVDDYEFMWVQRARYFLAMLAERQDMTGNLFNYPRTAFVCGDVLGAIQIESDLPGNDKYSNALLPADVDQIMYVAHIYSKLGFTGTRIKYEKQDALIIGILFVDKVDHSKNVISGDYAYFCLQDSKDKPFDIKTYTHPSIIKNLPSYVFGKGWTFSPGTLLKDMAANNKDHYSSLDLRLLFNFAEYAGRNYDFRARLTSVPSLSDVVRQDKYGGIIFSSFALHTIPIVVPDDANQLKERRSVGGVSIDRLVAIHAPTKIVPLKVAAPVTQKFIRVPLRVYLAHI